MQIFWCKTIISTANRAGWWRSYYFSLLRRAGGKILERRKEMMKWKVSGQKNGVLLMFEVACLLSRQCKMSDCNPHRSLSRSNWWTVRVFREILECFSYYFCQNSSNKNILLILCFQLQSQILANYAISFKPPDSRYRSTEWEGPRPLLKYVL